MAETSFFLDMMQSITERGRKLLFSSPTPQQRPSNSTDLETLCGLLLSSRGEASGMALAAEILNQWGLMDPAGQQKFIRLLYEKFGPDMDRLDAHVDAYRAGKTQKSVLALHEAAEPRRQELFRRLNLAPKGTSRLVEMRARLLAATDSGPESRAVDADMSHLFASWFNRGFLTLRPIDWSTPADILEKIIRYEAVHEISGWDELRRRLAPPDRRCFAFFHPRLSDEPLIFVEVALTGLIPSKIRDVLDEERAAIDLKQARTAVFYSISNCQEGLRGISFGNFLIKQVVEDLRRDMPQLDTFVTLSPVPGFANWLAKARTGDSTEILSDADRVTLNYLENPDWASDPKMASAVEAVLMPAAARYFLTERDAGGRPVDPVARFHLGNGARLERINFLADLSSKAMKQAHGLMVNYLYKLDDIETNHEALAQRGEVTASAAVKKLLSTERPNRGNMLASVTSRATPARV